VDFNNSQDNRFETSEDTRANRLPLLIGLGGVAVGALAAGFVIASSFGGSKPVNASDSELVSSLGTTELAEQQASESAPATTPVETRIIVVESQQAPQNQAGSQPSSQPETPAQPSQPTQPPAGQTNPTPPTATPTRPPVNNPPVNNPPVNNPPVNNPPTQTPPTTGITTPKFQYVNDATGGTTKQTSESTPPTKTVEARYILNGNRAGAKVALGGLTPNGSEKAQAQTYATFRAMRSTAKVSMDLRWQGTLTAGGLGNSKSDVRIDVIVSEINPVTREVVRILPSMPYSVYSKSKTGSGTPNIINAQPLDISGGKHVDLNVRLEPGKTYRVDTRVICSAERSGVGSTASCEATAAWAKIVVEYDKGICQMNEVGAGCIRPH